MNQEPTFGFNNLPKITQNNQKMEIEEKVMINVLDFSGKLKKQETQPTSEPKIHTDKLELKLDRPNVNLNPKTGLKPTIQISTNTKNSGTEVLSPPKAMYNCDSLNYSALLDQTYPDS